MASLCYRRYKQGHFEYEDLQMKYNLFVDREKEIENVEEFEDQMNNMLNADTEEILTEFSSPLINRCEKGYWKCPEGCTTYQYQGK